MILLNKSEDYIPSGYLKHELNMAGEWFFYIHLSVKYRSLSNIDRCNESNFPIWNLFEDSIPFIYEGTVFNATGKRFAQVHKRMWTRMKGNI